MEGCTELEGQTQQGQQQQQQAQQGQQQQAQQGQQRPQQQRQNKPRDAANGEKPGEVYQSMPIPADRVGWIIGKQGVYIQGLSQRSGCAITVSDSLSKDFGREWNYIHLQGTGRNVDRAKKLIYMRLEQFRATPPSTGQPTNP
jgi:hypothetical protein